METGVLADQQLWTDETVLSVLRVTLLALISIGRWAQHSWNPTSLHYPPAISLQPPATSAAIMTALAHASAPAVAMHGRAAGLRVSRSGFARLPQVQQVGHAPWLSPALSVP